MNNLNLPKGWNDISVEKFQELKLLSDEDYDTFDLLIQQLAIILDIDDKDELFETIDVDQLLEITKKLKWLYSEPSKNFIGKINDYKIKDIQKLSLEEFLDLEHYFNDNYFKNLHLICAILYKKYKTDEWNHIIEEPHNDYIFEKAEIFLDVSINNVYGIINYYLNFKENILNTYTSIFEDPNWDKIEDENNVLSQEEKIEIEQEIKEEKSKAVWTWPKIIYDLCNGDITKTNDITRLPLIYILNTLTMKKSLQL